MSEHKAFTCLMSIDGDFLPNSHSLDSSVETVKRTLRSMFALNSEFDIPVGNGLLCVLSSNAENTVNTSLTVTIRLHRNQNFVSINIDSCEPLIPADCNTLEANDLRGLEAISLSNNTMDKLRRQLSDALGIEVEKIPVLKRGLAVPNYFSSSDERVLEYDFEKILFNKRSSFQHIRILHSKTLGNALLLDDLQNLADSDIAYTHSLMKYGEICYEGKEVLILGGGDGALLHELLKEKPKFVLMVDIDEMVIESCREHLRASCGQVLDTLKSDNYEIIIGDCVKYLEEFAAENRKFDVIFNDLTDIPISTTADASKHLWDFVKKILNLSLRCLRDDGKYLNHATGAGSIKALETFEKLLTELPVKVKFSRHSAYVPSFLENWVFYEISKCNE
ncbi:spermine synthase-like isoform X1 [Dinothrombium tinctorium]|uniref:Spermine synthase-like isoform X1 n=1 Tax=Dinothrombium tinctorium TaxID=1965070 RepID=A0A3S3PBY8_9ACAR|nr:spermine synthase-like isoform X1 [Dinothrombium tinctorium]RWS16445.1 spermine synthase-like isoform X1 [Dinothrombium tinctorium]RWS16449.1 spermine synthase-like isoform X1 [Dinothrombium tinctorium]